MSSNIEKFSGTITFIINGRGEDYEDYEIIGEHPSTSESIEIDYDIMDSIREDKQFKELKDGVYHIYFTGEVNYYTIENWEVGTEYDAEVHLQYYNIRKL
jgi:hypothetical protein